MPVFTHTRRYARTVIARIFFALDCAARREIDLRSLRRSNLVAAFNQVDVEEDINAVNEYFSYEHFYVLYCKFWELDTDHDFLLSRADLDRMTGLTPAALDRVYNQHGRRFVAAGGPDGRHMGYEDFVTFFLASEDKTSVAALRCVRGCAVRRGAPLVRGGVSDSHSTRTRPLSPPAASGSTCATSTAMAC